MLIVVEDARLLLREACLRGTTPRKVRSTKEAPETAHGKRVAVTEISPGL